MLFEPLQPLYLIIGKKSSGLFSTKQLTLTVNKGIIRSLDNATGSKKMNQVYIVVEQVQYEGESIERVFAAHDAAVAYAAQLTAGNTAANVVYDVRSEWVVN